MSGIAGSTRPGPNLWNGSWKSMTEPPLPLTPPRRRRVAASPHCPAGAAEPPAPDRWEAVAKKLRLAVSVGLLSALAWRTDWHRIQEAFGQLRIEFWLAAVGVYFLAQIISGYRWQLLARPLGFPESLRQFIGVYFIGMYFNLLLPTSVGGDVVRAWCLDGQTGPRLASFLSVLVDRLSGLLVLLFVAGVGAVVCPVPLPAWVSGSVWGLAAGAACGLALLPLLTRWTARFAPLRRLAEAVRYYGRHPRLLLGT